MKQTVYLKKQDHNKLSKIYVLSCKCKTMLRTIYIIADVE